jgi:DHA1 family multidrug resistance protein-like MFS transporter
MEAWRRNLHVVFVANLVTSIGMTGFLPSFPALVRSLGVEDPAAVKIWAGAMAAAAPLMAAVMGPVWGAFGDRFGRKAMVVRAVGAIVVFTFAMSFVSRPWQLLVLRLVQGVFSGFVAPALTLVSVGAPADRQGRITGTLQAAVFGGAIVGPLTGGAVFDALGFRAVFRVCAGLAAVAVALLALFARDLGAAPRPLRLAAIFSPAPMGIGAGPVPPPSLGTSLRGAAAAFVADLRAILARGEIRAVLVGLFAMRFAASLVDPILQLYVEGFPGVDPAYLSTITGTVFAAHALAHFVALPFWGRWGDRHGHARTMRIAAASAGIGYLPQALAPDVVILAVSRFLASACFAGVLASAYGLTARATGEDRRGGAFGLVLSSLQFAHAVGPLAGGLLAAAIELRLLFGLAGFLLLASAWSGRGFRGPLRRLEGVRRG